MNAQPNTHVPFPGNSIYYPAFNFADNFGKRGREQEKNISASGTRVDKKTISIIMADDDEDDRDLFKEALEKNESDVNLSFAEDGRCLLDILVKGNSIPDLIFLDLNMPHFSGMQCLEEIRKHPRMKDIPIVIYSTSSSMKDIDEAYEKGANLYVRKPSSFHDLRMITLQVLALDWNIFKPHAARSEFLFNVKT